MNKKWIMYAVLLIFFLIILSVLSFSLEGDETTLSRLGFYFEMIATIGAVGGLFGLLYQFKRERELNEAKFIVDLNKDFIENPTISRIYRLLEQSKVEKYEKNPFKESDIIDMANYLSFFEPFWALIERKVVKIGTLDPVLGYRFFLVVNNRFVQEMLLCKSGKCTAWKAIYLLHNAWKKYRTNKGQKIWNEKYDLSKTEPYKEIIS